MKLINTVKNEKRTIPVGGAICGQRGDQLVLDAQDMKDLLAIPPDKLMPYIESLAARVRPVEILSKSKRTLTSEDINPLIAILSAPTH